MIDKGGHLRARSIIAAEHDEQSPGIYSQAQDRNCSINERFRIAGLQAMSKYLFWLLFTVYSAVTKAMVDLSSGQ
jgi:hypothetical protein